MADALYLWCKWSRHFPMKNGAQWQREYHTVAKKTRGRKLNGDGVIFTQSELQVKAKKKKVNYCLYSHKIKLLS